MNLVQIYFCARTTMSGLNKVLNSWFTILFQNPKILNLCVKNYEEKKTYISLPVILNFAVNSEMVCSKICD